MTHSAKSKSNTPLAMVALIVLQAFCAMFFIADVAADFVFTETAATEKIHLYVEAVASISLIAAIILEVQYLLKLLRRKAHLEDSLKLVNSAIHDVIEAEFESWKLTPAEQDVATFLVKGLSITEIAGMRESAEGTIKAHLNAIYRKSGTKNRAEMLSLLIDTMMGQKMEQTKFTA